MSIHTKCCIALAVLLVATDILMLIAGIPTVGIGRTAVIWMAAGSIHFRVDRLEIDATHMRSLAHAQLMAIERQTDIVRGRR